MKSIVLTLRGALVGAVLASTALSGAFAQEISESHLNAARAAISAISATDPFDSILPDAAENLRAALIVNNPDLESEIGDFVTEEAIALAARRADLEREAALVYARAFREEDLTAIANFYQGDAGKALIANGPIATRELSNAALVWRRGVERDLQVAVNKRLQDANLRAVPLEGELTTPEAGEGTAAQ